MTSGICLAREGDPNSIPPEEIRIAVGGKLSDIKECYNKEVKKGYEGSGKVVYMIRGRPDGSVTEANIFSSELVNGKKIEKCVSKIIRKIQFPKSSGQNKFEIKYPFVFGAVE